MGGASTRVSNAIKGLSERGHEIFVVTAFPHYPDGNIPREYRGRAFAIEGDSKVKVFRVWVPPLPHEGAKRLIMYVSFTLFSLLSLPFSGKVDVVWALSPNYFSAVSGFSYKMLKRVPLVLDVVDLWPEALVSLRVLTSKFLVGLVDAGLVFFYGVCDGIITLNEGMRNQILRKVVHPEKVFIVSNAVDLAVFKPKKVERFPELKGKFVVMYSGNLGQMYDFDTVLDTAKELSKTPNFAIVLRGNGDRMREIREKSKNLPVYLYQVNLDSKKLVDFLNMADVLLLPMKKLDNHYVSFPIKLVEYLGCGKAVVACAEGATSQLVYESNGGIVVEPRNSRDLSTAILRLHDNTDYCLKLGEKGRNFALEHFSLENMSTELERVLTMAGLH